MPRPRFDRLEPARRNAIFDAAVAEFGEHGFSRASYNRIIDRAGLSKGAMYYYFDDKRDLFVTVVSDAVDRLLKILEPVGSVTGIESFWDRVHVIMRSSWVGLSSQPRLSALMPAMLDPRNATDVPEAMATMNEGINAWVLDFIARGRAVGAIRGDLPDGLMMTLTLSVGEAIDRWVTQSVMASGSGAPASEPTPQMLQTIVDLLRRLLAPAPASAPAPAPAA